MLYLTLPILAAACSLSNTAPTTAPSTNSTTARKLLVSAPGKISLYSFTGANFTELTTLSVPGTSPSWLTLSSPTQILAVDENSAALNTFTLDLAKNIITPDASGTVMGSVGAVHLEFTPDRQSLFASAYGSGTVDVYSATNSSMPLTKQHTLTMGTAKQSNPHQTLFDPTGAFAVTNDLGLDKVFVTPINATSSSQSTSFPAPTGCGPRHGAWLKDANGNPVYALACEKSNQIITFETQYANSTLSLSQKTAISSIPPSIKSTSADAAGELVSPSGKSILVSNRRVDSTEGNIAQFTWDGKGLTFATSVGAGGFTPRMMSLAKKGDVLFVGNQSGEKGLVAFAVGSDGSLGKEVASVGMGKWEATGSNGPLFVHEVMGGEK